jgi:hypothetical protein
MNPHLTSAILTLAAGGFFALAAAYQLQNGAAFGFYYIWVDRTASPFWFWLLITVHTAIAIGLLVLGAAEVCLMLLHPG